MDYERKYKEALEKTAKSLYGQFFFVDNILLETIFPELKESKK